ncbi:hypothetical protein RB595_006388 [Gaeumannomyces hyphopodioides]
MTTSCLRAALCALLVAWASTMTALAGSSPSARAVLNAVAAAEPRKLTTTMSYTKDGKMSVMQEALRSVVPHASHSGGGGIPGAANWDAARQKREQQGGGGGETVTGIVVVATATISTATLATTVAVPHSGVEAAPASLRHRSSAGVGATAPPTAPASTTKKIPSSLQTNGAASGLRRQHDERLAAMVLWVTLLAAFGSVAVFTVAHLL